MKEIPGAPGYWADEEGAIWSSKRGSLRKLKLCANIHGYLQFETVLNGKRMTARVHALVALTYHGPRPKDLVVRHRDGNQTNNAPINLAYGTPSENQRDRRLHGTSSAGEGNPAAKLSAAEVASIRTRLRYGMRGRALAREHGVSESTISWIKTGKHWEEQQ